MNDKDQIFNLIVNNEKLEKLEVELNQFNPFSILKIDKTEIRHSNVLAWLLNPKENHNFSDKILKKFISQVVIDNEDKTPNSIDLRDIQLNNFTDSIILREYKNIDIMVVSEMNKFVLLIENKIYAKESKGQLTKYLDTVIKEYKGYKILPVFLTLTGEETYNNVEYCIFNHQSIVEIVGVTLELYKNNLSSQVYDFIQFYLKTLKGLTLMDEKLVSLCKDIYAEHEQALKKIFEVIHIDDTSFSPAADEFFRENEDVFETFRQAKRVCFLPKEFKELPKMKTNWNNGYPAAVLFEVYNDNLKIVYEIGPFDNGNIRINLMNHFSNDGIKILDRAKRIESKYTRIFTKYVKVKDWSDSDEILTKMNNLYSNITSKEREKFFHSIRQFDFSAKD